VVYLRLSVFSSPVFIYLFYFIYFYFYYFFIRRAAIAIGAHRLRGTPPPFGSFFLQFFYIYFIHYYFIYLFIYLFLFDTFPSFTAAPVKARRAAIEAIGAHRPSSAWYTSAVLRHAVPPSFFFSYFFCFFFSFFYEFYFISFYI
jgi:hypothetical protein